MKAACYRFRQKTRQKTAKSAVGAYAASHTTYCAAVSVGKRKSSRQTNQTSSRGLQSGYLIENIRSRRWPPRTKIPSQSWFHCTHANRQPYKSLPSAGSIRTWRRPCARTSSFSSHSSSLSTYKAIIQTWSSSSSSSYKPARTTSTSLIESSFS